MDNKIVESLDEIKGVGHRIVQGGAYFDKTVIADEDAVSKIDELASLAPSPPCHSTGDVELVPSCRPA